MKKLAMFAVAAGAALTATSALADGMPSRARGLACPAAAWQGFYIGAQIGTGYYSSQIAADDFLGITTRHDDNNGFIGGGTLGYNWATCNTIFGIEADLAATDLESHWGLGFGSLIPGAPNLFAAKSEVNWLGTIRTRGGIAVDNMLLYLTGGLAFAEIEHSGTTLIPGGPNAAFDDSDTRWGWTVGSGIEYKLGPSLSLKSEALYVRFDDNSFFYSFSPIAPGLGGLNLRAHDDMWVARFGLNYKFGDRREVLEPLK
jgi:outer membrane immunogenic protein